MLPTTYSRYCLKLVTTCVIMPTTWSRHGLKIVNMCVILPTSYSRYRLKLVTICVIMPTPCSRHRLKIVNMCIILPTTCSRQEVILQLHSSLRSCPAQIFAAKLCSKNLPIPVSCPALITTHSNTKQWLKRL